MRELKVCGGLTHGRSITESNHTKFAFLQPVCSKITNAIGKLCRVHIETSEQHVERRSFRLIADSKVNVDLAKVIGHSSMLGMVGQNYADVKFKINPQQLFLRISCILKPPRGYEEYMCYELAPKPPSLFDRSLMRKTNKSVLEDILQKYIPGVDSYPGSNSYLVDGCHLLHKVLLPRPATYLQLCETYVRYVITHCGPGSSVVFYGYNGPMTTKN
ncbi:hypothetical protein PR048_006133 [Dryococelus australis]|uniref:Uncharacterized protein n=1 Tax=Dryococelus australis TaxID=614101 RepID=A0ABQ9IA40_9NEOP|nr:hypothetical protein PR048_006133 [Dryococelus australis]